MKMWYVHQCLLLLPLTLQRLQLLSSLSSLPLLLLETDPVFTSTKSSTSFLCLCIHFFLLSILSSFFRSLFFISSSALSFFCSPCRQTAYPQSLTFINFIYLHAILVLILFFRLFSVAGVLNIIFILSFVTMRKWWLPKMFTRKIKYYRINKYYRTITVSIQRKFLREVSEPMREREDLRDAILQEFKP